MCLWQNRLRFKGINEGKLGNSKKGRNLMKKLSYKGAGKAQKSKLQSLRKGNMKGTKCLVMNSWNNIFHVLQILST